MPVIHNGKVYSLKPNTSATLEKNSPRNYYRKRLNVCFRDEIGERNTVKIPSRRILLTTKNIKVIRHRFDVSVSEAVRMSLQLVAEAIRCGAMSLKLLKESPNA